MAIKKIRNHYIIDYADVDLFNRKEVLNLSDHTANTWQAKRSHAEKIKDTYLGKIAENAVITAFHYFGIDNYISYDEIRIDDFEEHAPFDGVFCKSISNDVIQLIYKSILKDGAKLSEEVRTYLRNNKIITCEVKSTRLTDKYKNKVGFKGYEDNDSLEHLFDYLDSLDYITYPYFTRYGNYSFEQYCEFVARKKGLKLIGDELKDYIKKIELIFASDIYLRVFVDEKEKKFIIMGWITKWKLLDPPETHKLYQRGKSEVPLYFVKSISKGFDLKTLKNYIDKIINS